MALRNTLYQIIIVNIDSIEQVFLYPMSPVITTPKLSMILSSQPNNISTAHVNSATVASPPTCVSVGHTVGRGVMGLLV